MRGLSGNAQATVIVRPGASTRQVHCVSISVTDRSWLRFRRPNSSTRQARAVNRGYSANVVIASCDNMRSGTRYIDSPGCPWLVPVRASCSCRSKAEDDLASSLPPNIHTYSRAGFSDPGRPDSWPWLRIGERLFSPSLQQISSREGTTGDVRSTTEQTIEPRPRSFSIT